MLSTVYLRLGSDYGTKAELTVGHGSTDLDGSRGSWVSTRDPLTHEPLTDDYVNRVSRTISLSFGIKPTKHATILLR